MSDDEIADKVDELTALATLGFLIVGLVVLFVGDPIIGIGLLVAANIFKF